jgi:hypothetical protein
VPQVCVELEDKKLSRSKKRGYVVARVVGTPHSNRYRADVSSRGTWESRCLVAR